MTYKIAIIEEIHKDGIELLNKNPNYEYELITDVSERNLIDGAKAYIKFGLKNANTYDLMFGTAIKDFTKYPMLFEAANKTYLHIRSTFKEFSKNKDDLYIEESCIDIWAKIHGMVGLLRKLEVVPVKLVEMPDTPFKAINLISKDLDSYLKKFFNKF